METNSLQHKQSQIYLGDMVSLKWVSNWLIQVGNFWKVVIRGEARKQGREGRKRTEGKLDCRDEAEDLGESLSWQNQGLRTWFIGSLFMFMRTMFTVHVHGSESLCSGLIILQPQIVDRQGDTFVIWFKLAILQYISEWYGLYNKYIWSSIC